MKVKDKDTGLILESDNAIVNEQWVKHPEKYALSKADTIRIAKEKEKAVKRNGR